MKLCAQIYSSAFNYTCFVQEGQGRQANFDEIPGDLGNGDAVPRALAAWGVVARQQQARGSCMTVSVAQAKR